MRNVKLHRTIILVMAVALGAASMATDALAKGGGGGGHGGGGGGGGHGGRGAPGGAVGVGHVGSGLGGAHTGSASRAHFSDGAIGVRVGHAFGEE